MYTGVSPRFNRATPYAFGAFGGANDTTALASAASGGADSLVITEPVAANGANIRLWDSIAVQAFFDPDAALRFLYFRDVAELRYAGAKTEDGVTYQILAHTTKNGTIGGEKAVFEQQVYVDPNGRITRYTLEFRAGEHTGVQVMRLYNIRVGDATPLTPADFAVATPTTP